MKRLRQIAKSRTFQVLFVVLVVFISLVVHRYHLFGRKQIVISSETTYITEPLRKDGRGVDYFAALESRYYPETMQTDDNGYRIIARALGDMSDYQSDRLPYGEPAYTPDELTTFKTQTYEKLGLDPNIQPTMTFIGAREYLQDDLGEDVPKEEFNEQWNLFINQSWTDDQNPLMGCWLEENTEALDLIAEAVKQPEFQIPYIRRTPEEPFRDYMRGAWRDTARSIAISYKARANYRVGTSDIDGAIDDVVACLTLARHLQGQGTDLWLLAGLGCESVGYSIELGLSKEHPLTANQLQRLLEAGDALPSRPDPHEFLFSVRLWILDYMQGAALDELPPDQVPGSQPDEKSHWGESAVDWNVAMRRINELYDLAVENPYELEEYLDQLGEPESLDRLRLVLSLKANSEAVGDIAVAMTFPACQATNEAQRRLLCTERVRNITLGMLLYEQEHSTLPPPFSVDKNGHPLHSWRVLILPHIGQKELYDQIRLDESWDSEHNRQFHEVDVSFYCCPSAEESRSGRTSYSVVVGEKTAFHTDRPEPGPKSLSQMIVVERKKTICWMDPSREPDDNFGPYPINSPDGPIGSNHPGGMIYGVRSGSARFIADYCDSAFIPLLEGTLAPEDRYY
jgi:hypothetical protein